MTEYLDRMPTMHEYAEGKRIDPKLTDYISIADAIEAVNMLDIFPPTKDAVARELMALPSADAVSREVYHNLVTASNDIDRALREYQEAEENGDFVKVVRCKDCRHRVHDKERGLYYCEMYYGQGDVSDENFCQWGERREE